MAYKIDHLEKVTAVAEALEEKGLRPVLVGGIALAILGSQRVTRDFDFLMSLQDSNVDDLTAIFYKHGFELVTKFNREGEVLRTVDNQRVAAIKLKAELPQSLFFFDWETRLKVDLLLDFPLPAHEVAGRSIKVKIKSRSLRVASEQDLLRLKEIAYADRRSAADAQDLAFLRARRKDSRSSR